MPAYDFQCQNDNCDINVFEIIESIRVDLKANPPKCPKCEEPSKKQVMGGGRAPEVIFKGHGWFNKGGY